VDLDLEELFLKCQAQLPQNVAVQDSGDFASDLLLNAARKGFPFSQYYVGRCFEQGKATIDAATQHLPCGYALNLNSYLWSQDKYERNHIWIKKVSISAALYLTSHAQLCVKLHKAIPIRDVEVAAHHDILHDHSLQPFSAHQLSMLMFTKFCRQGYSR